MQFITPFLFEGNLETPDLVKTEITYEFYPAERGHPAYCQIEAVTVDGKEVTDKVTSSDIDELEWLAMDDHNDRQEAAKERQSKEETNYQISLSRAVMACGYGG